MLKEPKAIITNGNKKVFAAATGIIWGYIIDQASKRVPVRISAMFVPGLGCNAFSSIKAMQSGVSTILETGNTHLQFDSCTSLPLTQHPEDKDVCSYDVFLRTLGGTADTSSTRAVVPAAQTSNDANRGNLTFTETEEVCTNSSIAMEHTTTVTPQRKRVSARYGQNIATQKECTPTGGNNTPEEANATETERQHAQIPDITPKKAIFTETERFCSLVQVMLHIYENNFLEEEKLSTTAGKSSTEAGASSSEEKASSSPEIGESSSRAGVLPQEVGVSLAGITPAITPGEAHSTTAGGAPDVPHHETASTRPHPRVEDTFDNMHATEALGTKPPTSCVEFTYPERDPFRISEGDNRVIQIPNDILRCHPLHGSASAGITGTGITGAGPTASHGTIGVAESSPSGTTGPSAEPMVDGSTMSASPGITPATFEPSVGAKPNNSTDRQEETHTLTTAKGQPRENPETGFAESTHDDQEPLATSPAFVYTRKPTLGFLSILNEEPINIEAKTQRVAA